MGVVVGAAGADPTLLVPPAEGMAAAAGRQLGAPMHRLAALLLACGVRAHQPSRLTLAPAAAWGCLQAASKQRCSVTDK